MIATLRDDEQHKHRNGGGWIADTAHVADSVFVGPFAIVYGKAVLTDRVRVEDFAQVSGDTKLSGDTRVCRNAWVSHGSHKSGVFSRNERKQEKQERLQPAGDGL